MSKLRKIISKVDLELVLHTFVSSRSDYYNSLFTHNTETHIYTIMLLSEALEYYWKMVCFIPNYIILSSYGKFGS